MVLSGSSGHGGIRLSAAFATSPLVLRVRGLLDHPMATIDLVSHKSDRLKGQLLAAGVGFPDW